MSSFLQNGFIDKSISELYLKSDLADVKFAFEHDGSTVLVPAHKVILASASPVFRAMFFGPLAEKNIVEILDASAEEFEEFLQFFYLRKLKLTTENLEGVTRLADKYDMLDCLNDCVSFLESQITDENMFWGYQLAISLNNQPLKQFCESKIAFLPNMFKTEAFLNCDQKILKAILLMETLNFNEIDIFEACVAWAKAACRKHQLNENDSKNLKNQLGDCIYLIHFSEMASDELGAILVNKLYSGMFDRDELLEITRTSLVPNFKSEIFKNSSRINRLLSFSTNKNSELEMNIDYVNLGNLPYLQAAKATHTTWFTSNTLLLMGKITISNAICTKFVDSDFNIINHHSNKTLYNGKVNRTLEVNRNFEVNLANGILIKPHELYGISVNIPPHCCYNQCIYYVRAEIKLTSDIAIKFHDNPNGTQEDNGGLVKAISFKRV